MMRFVAPELADPMRYPKAVRRAVAQRQQAVRQARQEHRERIRPLLPPSLQRLQETPLDDARIRSLRIDAGQRALQLCLLCGDVQHGYAELTLDYKEILLTPQETSLICLLAHEASVEIDCDEIDVEAGADSPVFIHRISWHTGVEIGRETDGAGLNGEMGYSVTLLEPEIELRFGGLEIAIIPRPDRHAARAENVITVVRAPAPDFADLLGREHDRSARDCRANGGERAETRGAARADALSDGACPELAYPGGSEGS